MQNKSKGIFICVEGGEGSGKSTISSNLRDYYESQGKEVVLTREPGGVAACEEIRETILKTREGAQLDPMTEAYLFVASRNEHLKKKVIPALEAGKIVIMDRYFYSSLAYQGEARGLGFEAVWRINEPVVQAAIPDITLYLKISPETRRKRLAGRGESALNRLDKEPESFHDAVQRGYERCKIFPEFCVIDGEGSPDDIFKRCLIEIQGEGKVQHHKK